LYFFYKNRAASDGLTNKFDGKGVIFETGRIVFIVKSKLFNEFLFLKKTFLKNDTIIT